MTTVLENQKGPEQKGSADLALNAKDAATAKSLQALDVESTLDGLIVRLRNGTIHEFSSAVGDEIKGLFSTEEGQASLRAYMYRYRPDHLYHLTDDIRSRLLYWKAGVLLLDPTNQESAHLLVDCLKDDSLVLKFSPAALKRIEQCAEDIKGSSTENLITTSLKRYYEAHVGKVDAGFPWAKTAKSVLVSLGVEL